MGVWVVPVCNEREMARNKAAPLTIRYSLFLGGHKDLFHPLYTILLCVLGQCLCGVASFACNSNGQMESAESIKLLINELYV